MDIKHKPQQPSPCSLRLLAWSGVVRMFVSWIIFENSAYGQTSSTDSLPQRLPPTAQAYSTPYEPEQLPDALWIQEPSEDAEPVVPNTQRPPPAGGGMMGMGGGGSKSPVRYGIMWQPDVAVEGQATDLGLIQHDLNLMYPVWKSDPHTVILSGGVQLDLFNTDAVLPDSGRAFPAELWNIKLGMNYIRRFDNGWTGGASANIGSASDQPFSAMRDVNFGMFAFLRVPHRERNAWNLSLAYAPLSPIPFPIPMASYQWQKSDAFSMNIGVPLQMTYRPTERLKFDVSYMLLTTVHAQATYQLNDQWTTYGAFDWQNQSWFLDDRQDRKERLFSYDKRLSVGVKTKVLKHLAVDLSTGYLFDRYFFTGQNFNDSDHDRIDIGSGLFASAQAGLTW
jgi:hypothetical protein